MSVNEKYHAVFKPGECYHVYNCTNNGEKLFRSNENYYFFLKKYGHYMQPFAETFAYNLLPNHFHTVCRLRSAETIQQYLACIKQENLLKAELAFLENTELYFDNLIESQFHRFFTSYSMSFNKMYSRKGNLFHRAFKRVHIADEKQLFHTVIYVHANAVKHKIVKQLEGYPFTSYHSYLSDAASLLSREEIFNLFGGKEAFVRMHKEQTDYYYKDPGFDDE
ncbi:MAG: hypothetical protein K2X48_07780 [Chitinophagaceae bacterium]|nr:hypothetical protein [Chitinophagaceae bacterium]